VAEISAGCQVPDTGKDDLVADKDPGGLREALFAPEGEGYRDAYEGSFIPDNLRELEFHRDAKVSCRLSYRNLM
jgi:hypothetical protein